MPDTKQPPPALRAAIEEFERWSDDHLSAEQKNSTITEPLYHYTDGRGLKGIIESQTIWFTDYRHLNDPSELSYGIEKARDLMHQAATGADVYGRAFLECLSDMLSLTKFPRLEFFIASFSRERNELGQWRAYADNGLGYALGIQASVLDDLEGFVSPVFYCPTKILNRHSLAIDKALAIFQNAVGADPLLMGDADLFDQFIQTYCRAILASVLIWNCLTSKHKAYDREQEVRLIIMGHRDKLTPRIKTRLRGSEIVPYIAQPLALRGPEAIFEIVTGPAAGADAERTIRTMLRSFSADDRVPIEPSGIPYRPL
jgi:hypothetical protein